MVKELTLPLPASGRTVLRQLEDLLPQIEDGLARGYSHAAIHAALAELGITIGLPYYHRALHKLRKEKREGTRSRRTVLHPTREPAQIPRLEDLQRQPLSVPDTSRVSNLSDAIAPKSQSKVGNIGIEQPQTQPFRWKGQDFLNKDWSNF